MGVIKTRVVEQTIKLKKLGAEVKVPRNIQTWLGLTRPVVVKGKEYMFVVVSTMVGFDNKFFHADSEKGETYAFPAQKDGRWDNTQMIEELPFAQHEKSLHSALIEHERVCMEILAKYG